MNKMKYLVLGTSVGVALLGTAYFANNVWELMMVFQAFRLVILAVQEWMSLISPLTKVT